MTIWTWDVMKAKLSTKKYDAYLLPVASASGVVGSGIRYGINYSHSLAFAALMVRRQVPRGGRDTRI